MRLHIAMGAKFFRTGAIILACMGLFDPASHTLAADTQATKELHVLASTFPMSLFTRNVINGVEGVKVESMIPAAMGCPHDYALTPADMGKIRRSDLFIANGLGLEEFLGAPLQRANPGIVVVDTSRGITDLLEIAPARSEKDHEHNHDSSTKTPHREAVHEPAETHDSRHRGHGRDDHGEENDDHHEHDHRGANPHLFASPSMAVRIVQNIAQALALADPAHAEAYLRNASAYAASLADLAEQFERAGQKLRTRKIVTQHAVFDYLARDMGLEIVAVVAEDPGQEPSAAEMLRIVKVIKKQGAASIFTEPQYPAKVGRTIASEAGISVEILDPVASGPDNAPLDYYQQVMRKNLETLKKTLGYEAG